MKLDWSALVSAKHLHWMLLSFIAFFSLMIIYQWSTLRVFPEVTVSAEQEQLPSPPKSPSFQAIANASLFGDYVATDLNESSVKKSLLRIKVVGILFSKPMKNSQVILRTASGDEKIYKVGDTIPGDAIIKRITSEGVLVLRRGNLESLSLPKNELNFEPLAEPIKHEE